MLSESGVVGRALESMDWAVGSLVIVLEMAKRLAIHHRDGCNRAAMGRNARNLPWEVLGFLQHTMWLIVVTTIVRFR